MSPTLIFPKVRLTHPYKLDVISSGFVTCTNRPTNIRQTQRPFIKNLVQLRVSAFVQAEGGLVRAEIPNCIRFFDKRVLWLTGIYWSEEAVRIE
jgi:hypothetical protein